MNEGVELLLKRMDSHPEEFEDQYNRYQEEGSKWSDMIYLIRNRIEIMDHENGAENTTGLRAVRQAKPLAYLTNEEVVALHEKLLEVQRNMFVKKVMATLLDVAPKPGEFVEAHPSPVTTNP